LACLQRWHSLSLRRPHLHPQLLRLRLLRPLLSRRLPPNRLLCRLTPRQFPLRLRLRLLPLLRPRPQQRRLSPLLNRRHSSFSVHSR
jgi:hypothetical protein